MYDVVSLTPCQGTAMNPDLIDAAVSGGYTWLGVVIVVAQSREHGIGDFRPHNL